MVMTTFSNPETGRKLAEGLLEQKLAACVQTMAIQSTYRWKGAIQQEPETLMLIKTKGSLYPRVEAWIRDQHDYEVPEVIQIPVTDGLPDYLRWVAEETQ
jgi:periplasmic divalent cation tolerance protein